MSALRFVLEHAAVALLLGGSAAVLGGILTGSLEFDGRLERWSFTTAIGLGVLGNAVHVLGLLGAIRPVAVLLVLAAPLAISVTLRARRARPRAHRRPHSLLGGLPLLLGLAPAAALALYPPTDFDATMYHLPYARAFSSLHAVAFLPSLRFPIFPQLIEMLFTAALTISDDVSAQLIHFLCLTLVAVALIAWGRRLSAGRAGVWAAAAWLGSPLVLSEGASAYVDVGLALFCTLSVYAWSVWSETGDERWLFWSAALAGFAASTKYLGLFFVFAIPAATWVAKRRGGLGPALRHFAVSVLVLFPFYARITAETGNPLFPFFAGLFGTSEWSQPLNPGFPEGGAVRVFSELLLPGNLHPRRTTYSPFLLLVPPLLVGAAIAERRQRPLLVLAAAFVTCCYALSRDPRYLLPVVPTCTLCAASFLDLLLRRRGIPRRISEGALAGALAFALVLPGGAWAAHRLWRFGPLPVTAAERAAYLDERVEVHSALARLNSTLGAGYTVYCFHCENAAYFAEGRFLGDHFGPYRFSRLEAAFGNGRLLYSALRGMGATHLIVGSDRGSVPLPSDSSFRALFERIPVPGGVLLFALRPDSGRLPRNATVSYHAGSRSTS